MVMKELSIEEKAKTEKQRVLLTETDGTANIDWDCRSLDDVKVLLKCGLEFIRTIEANKQILTDSRFGGCSLRVPSRYDKDIKQGEQKPAEKVEPKFHEGDMIIHKELGGDYIHNPHKIIQVDILDKKYRLEGGLVAHFGEQDDYELIEQNPAWSEEDEELMKWSIINLTELKDRFGEEYGKVGDCIDWLKSIKDRIQPKQEWSEEDKRALNDAIVALSMYANGNIPHILPSILLEDVEKLKSLRPQNKWRPSEVQMKALRSAIHSYGTHCGSDPLYHVVLTLEKDLRAL